MDNGSALRVLLISPLRSLDVNSGDVTFTEQLVEDPPPGVVYVTYDHAMASGDLVEIGTLASVRAGTFGDRARALSIAVWRKAEGYARRTGWVYRERLRHFSVADGAFDLVHVHVFPTRLVGGHPPMVMSAGAPLRWLYQDAWGWSDTHAAVADAFDRLVGRVWGATMCDGSIGQSARLIVATHRYKDWVEGRDPESRGRVDVVPNYVAGASTEGTSVDRLGAAALPHRLGFIAKDFTAKGGPTLLAAFAAAREQVPHLTLTVVGSEVPDQMPPGVRWLPFVAREQLIDEVLPSMDVLVHPTRVDVLPYSPMEALSLGIPVVVSDHRSLPEMASHGAGRVARVDDADSLTAAILELLDPAAHAAAAAAARAHFAASYSAATQAPRLRDSYDRALG